MEASVSPWVPALNPEAGEVQVKLEAGAYTHPLFGST
jgi:hypothetical protein